MSNALPLVRIRRRLEVGDYLLVEIDGPNQSWLNAPSSYGTREAARDALLGLGRTEAVRCPDCEGGYVEITEPCPRCGGRCIVPTAE